MKLARGSLAVGKTKQRNRHCDAAADPASQIDIHMLKQAAKDHAEFPSDRVRCQVAFALRAGGAPSGLYHASEIGFPDELLALFEPVARSHHG